MAGTGRSLPHQTGAVTEPVVLEPNDAFHLLAGQEPTRGRV
jgi:hypothetical protein